MRTREARIRSRLCIPVLLAMGGWLGGCTCAGSLRPLESDEPLAVTPDLTGRWVSEESNNQEEYSVIESTGSSTYRVTHINTSEEVKDVYEFSLVQVGGYTFFDVAFKEVGNEKTTKNASDLGVIPIHFIGRIWMEGDTLRLGFLDYDWIHQVASSGKLILPHVEREEGDDHILLLAAENNDLRAFVRENAEEPAAFSTVLTFHRGPTPDGSPKVTNP